MQTTHPHLGSFRPGGRLLEALDVRASELPVEVYHNGPPHVYVGLASEQAVAEVKPNMAALTELNVGANCFAGRGRSWKTRMFYPLPACLRTRHRLGGRPVGGSPGPHGQIAFGEEIEIRQGEEIGRPSRLYARAVGTPGRLETVEVGGERSHSRRGVFRISET